MNNGEAEIFYVKTLGCKMPDNAGLGCFFTALMPLGQRETGKCVASNSEKKLSLKTFNKDSPHPDIFFLIKEETV